MDRRITVKGIGHMSAKPDYVIIHLTIEETNKKYDKAVEDASDKINELSASLVNIGFESDSLKTVDFKVNIATGYKKNLKVLMRLLKQDIPVRTG